jgi:hypothetical protein
MLIQEMRLTSTLHTNLMCKGEVSVTRIVTKSVLLVSSIDRDIYPLVV